MFCVLSDALLCCLNLMYAIITVLVKFGLLSARILGQYM